MPNARLFWCKGLSLALVLSPAGGGSFTGQLLGDESPLAVKPATSQPDPRIADAINQLGSDDFDAREKAAKTLWEFGDAAIPALREAAASDEPELARRARGVLNSFAFGIRPDTPRVLIDLVNDFRQGEVEQKKHAIIGIAGQGSHGARILLKLATDERNEEMRSLLVNGLAGMSRPACARLIAEGDGAAAERILETIAVQAEGPARDHAAYLLRAGGLDNAIAKLEAIPTKKLPADFLRLSCLYRAKGDLKKASAAADEAGETQLAELLLADAGRFAELADRVELRGVLDNSVDEIGYATAYHRLAGDKVAAEKSARRLVKYADVRPDDHWNAAESLLLNGFPALAVDVLLAHDNPAMAMEFLGPRLEFDRIDKAMEQAKLDGFTDLPRVLSKAAGPMHFQGRTADAREMLLNVALGKNGTVDLETWIELIETAPAVNIPQEKIDAWVAQTLMQARTPQDLIKILHKARFQDADRALLWWRTLRDHRANRSPVDAIATARQLDRMQIKGDDLTALLEKTRELAASLPPAERTERLQLVADTYADQNRFDDAIAVSESIVEKAKTSVTWMRLGDLLGKAGKWEGALAAYSSAVEADRSEPGPLALKGRALLKLGDSKQGHRLIELSHLMPLANESQRHSLAELFVEHGMKEDARIERDLNRLLGDGRTWAYTDSLRKLADQTSRDGDTLAAADMWERAFLLNYNSLISFVEPSANLTIPVLIHRMRSIGQIRKGNIPQAMIECDACFDQNPGDPDSQIAIIKELDKTGHHAEADKVFQRAVDRFDALRKQHPQSAVAANMVAWVSACSTRNLDVALRCAQDALKIQPDSSAILDTLSEVYFARKEYDEALKINAKCQEREPYLKHHQRNGERFKLAKEGKPIPEPGVEKEAE